MTCLWVLIAVVVTAVITTAVVSSRKRAKIDYMLDALEDNETNFRFSETGAEKRFNRTLNRMRRIFEKEKLQIQEQEKYFGLMLDKVTTGIVVTDDDQGHVVYYNMCACKLLGINSIVNIRQLGPISAELRDAFLAAASGQGSNVNFTNDMSSRTLGLRPSVVTIGNKVLTIIVFNDISSEMGEIESESWSKLIRVLIHEIMNTVTPITSLSQTLAEYSGAMSREEIRSGLETIYSSSQGLLKFVESYRNMMHVPEPMRKVVVLRELVERVIRLAGAEGSAAAGAEGAATSGAEGAGVGGRRPVIEYQELSEDIILYVDEDQIAQILLNLIKNAVAAGASRVMISAEIAADERTVMNISNDGAPIPAELQEQIFVPFFTTKKEGSGIGLSLSRQIMRRHGGSLLLTRSDTQSTVFTLTF